MTHPAEQPIIKIVGTLLKMAGLGGLSWLTPISQALAIDAERNQRKPTAKSVIILWLNGAASQLETFDPHPGTDIAAESKARPTAVQGDFSWAKA